ncbi:MAG: hypothetical protein MJA83_16810 [Gammaproteobacteria bacterium]|nr:hypothetical protein [Gammaproteobacteria bacterium]
MKLKKVEFNNRKKLFEIDTKKGFYTFPYSALDLKPEKGNWVREAFVDRDIGNEGFTYVLDSGEEDTIHIDRVLEVNRDPDYMRDLLLYRITLLAKEIVDKSEINKKEIARRLSTSPSQFYRLIDVNYKKKTLDQMFRLFYTLNYDLDVKVKQTSNGRIASTNRKILTV